MSNEKEQHDERAETGSVWWVVFEAGETSGEVGDRPWNDNLAKPYLEHSLEHLNATNCSYYSKSRIGAVYVAYLTQHEKVTGRVVEDDKLRHFSRVHRDMLLDMKKYKKDTYLQS